MHVVFVVCLHPHVDACQSDYSFIKCNVCHSRSDSAHSVHKCMITSRPQLDMCWMSAEVQRVQKNTKKKNNNKIFR